MASTRQERLTPGATFIDASGRTRWRSRVPGVSDVEADIGEEAEPDSSLPALTSLRNALSEEVTDSSAGVSSALARFSKAAQERSAGMNERARLTQEAETETFPEIRPVFLSPSLATMPWASETDEQESTAARAAGKPEDQLRRERFLQAYQDTYGLVPPVGHPSLDGVEALRSVDVASPITTASTPVRADGPGVVPGTAPSTTPKPVTVASVPVKTSDIATAIPTASSVGTTAIAPTTSTSPAGRPDSAGVPNLPAPSSEGAGGDASERDLYLARLAAQNAAGFGSMGAGKNIDMGIADTLGERMKQIAALRAKREERSADVAQEQAQYEGANLATLATQLAAFKDRPDIVAALQNLKPGAKYTKPSEFIKSAYQAVTNPPTVAAKEAAGKLAGERTETVKQERPAKVGLVENKVRSEQERTKLLREQAGLTAAKAEALRAEKEKGALIKEAGPSKGPFSDPKLELRRKAAFTKETTAAGKLYTEPTQQLASLERESGDLIDGRTPAWWNPANVALLQKGVTSGLPDDALKFAKKYYAVINPLRHGLFGSALTDGEQKAFADQIEIALLRGPRDLGMALKELMSMQKDKTKLRLGFILNEAPDLAGAWLQTSGFSDSIKGTSFEDMFPQPAAAGTVRIQRKADGKIVSIPAADKARYLADPRFQEAP